MQVCACSPRPCLSLAGMEAAAFLCDKAAAIAVVEKQEFPFQRVLGPQVGGITMKVRKSGCPFLGWGTHVIQAAPRSTSQWSPGAAHTEGAMHTGWSQPPSLTSLFSLKPFFLPDPPHAPIPTRPTEQSQTSRHPAQPLNLSELHLQHSSLEFPSERSPHPFQMLRNKGVKFYMKAELRELQGKDGKVNPAAAIPKLLLLGGKIPNRG